MKVKEIMTKDVASLTPTDTVEQAAQLMSQYNVGSIPVCRNQQIVGIVTDRDVAIRSAAQGESIKSQKISDIMTTNPVVCDSNTDIKDAARIMSERQIRRLPIVENNALIGIVSLGDIAVDEKGHNEAGEALSSISEPSTPEI